MDLIPLHSHLLRAKHHLVAITNLLHLVLARLIKTIELASSELHCWITMTVNIIISVLSWSCIRLSKVWQSRNFACVVYKFTVLVSCWRPFHNNHTPGARKLCTLTVSSRTKVCLLLKDREQPWTSDCTILTIRVVTCNLPKRVVWAPFVESRVDYQVNGPTRATLWLLSL